MPELIEVEAYRRAAEGVVGRRISRVDATDAWYLKGGVGPGSLADLLMGSVVTAARRRGKLLMLDLDRGEVLGLRFGMTGRLLTAGPAAEQVSASLAGGRRGDPVGRLLYSAGSDDPRFVRFALGFSDASALWISDPRRLGGVELGPDEARLGPDAATVTVDELRGAMEGGELPLKAALMDQRRVAGVGNLLCDEILWRARLSPLRPAGSLDEAAVEALGEVLTATVADLSERGGSHTGDLQPSRERGGRCPRCGAALRRDEVGGRTTYWCPAEQV